MIVDGILLVLQGVLSVLLLPLTGLNIAVDFLASIPVVTTFLQCVAYLLPWSNLFPLISIVVGIFIFRIAISIIKTVWQLLPFV